MIDFGFHLVLKYNTLILSFEFSFRLFPRSQNVTFLIFEFWI